jgi:hypothetical protein
VDETVNKNVHALSIARVDSTPRGEPGKLIPAPNPVSRNTVHFTTAGYLSKIRRRVAQIPMTQLRHGYSWVYSQSDQAEDVVLAAGRHRSRQAVLIEELL